MNDRTALALSILTGAVIGGLAGFLLFTDRGRRLRAEIGPMLEHLSRELQELQDTAFQVRDSATHGWQRIEQFMNALGEQQHSSNSGAAHDSRSH
jgi:gas vesicle protein